MTDKLFILLVALFGLAALMASFCADYYEAGVRAGYERGLEDGIRITNEVIEEGQ